MLLVDLRRQQIENRVIVTKERVEVYDFEPGTTEHA